MKSSVYIMTEPHMCTQQSSGGVLQVFKQIGSQSRNIFGSKMTELRDKGKNKVYENEDDFYSVLLYAIDKKKEISRNIANPFRF